MLTIRSLNTAILTDSYKSGKPILLLVRNTDGEGGKCVRRTFKVERIDGNNVILRELELGTRAPTERFFKVPFDVEVELTPLHS